MTDVTHSKTRAELLIGELASELRPIRRVAAPLAQTGAWAAAVLMLAIAIGVTVDLSTVAARLTGAPDLWLAVVGSSLTAVLAAFAAFQVSLPDRRLGWTLLPLPALALWLGASGLGCLRSWVIPGVPIIPTDHIKECLLFIMGFSIPLSVLLLLMLRRAYSLHPTTTAVLAGLAVAAAAASLLTLVHPFEATFTDLAVHFFSVALVVLINRMVGGKLLSPSAR